MNRFNFLDGRSLCRYRYRDGLCAHALIDGQRCVGEEDCPLTHELSVEGGGSPMARWRGLYCPMYQRFYCPGMDICGSTSSYMIGLAEFRRSRGY
ncbi:MAG: hypothetical protein ACLFPN_04080 [Methanomassiliicoccales archaeon]